MSSCGSCWLFLSLIFISGFLYAQKQGDVARVIRDTELLENPEENSIGYGILPEGTIVQYIGENIREFTKVRVELLDGEIEGWLPVNVLEESSEEQKTRKKLKTKKVVTISKPSSRLKIPKDEGLAMRREKGLVYGFGAGAHFDIARTNVDENFYFGLGYKALGIIGYPFSRYFLGRLEVGYSLINASSSEQPKPLQFGFVDFGFLVDYSLMERLSVFGGIEYSVGASIGDIPENIAQSLNTSSDLSSLYFACGLGYKIPLDNYISFSLRAKGTVAFLLDPIHISTIGIEAALEFGG